MDAATEKYLEQEEIAGTFNETIRAICGRTSPYLIGRGDGDCNAAEDNLVTAALDGDHLPPAPYVDFVLEYDVDWKSTDYEDTRVQNAIRTLNQRPEIAEEFRVRGIDPPA